MDNFKELVKEYISIDLTDRQISKFKTLAQELIEANKITNLTAIKDIEGIYIKHFLDSLTVINALPENTKTIVDVGSGAGFPGLPLAIARPDIKVTMLESTGKKVSFIDKMIKTLEVPNAYVINERAENLSKIKHYAERYDVAVARAVAFLPTLIEYCFPLVRKGGLMIAMKNENETELIEAKDTLERLNASIKEILPVELPNISKRQLVVISK